MEDKKKKKERKFEFLCTGCNAHWFEKCELGENYYSDMDLGFYVIKNAKGIIVRAVRCPVCRKARGAIRPYPVGRRRKYRTR